MGRHCLVAHDIEDARSHPLVTTGSQRRIRETALDDRFDRDPRASNHLPDQDTPEAQPIRDPSSVTPLRWSSGTLRINASIVSHTESATSGSRARIQITSTDSLALNPGDIAAEAIQGPMDLSAYARGPPAIAVRDLRDFADCPSVTPGLEHHSRVHSVHECDLLSCDPHCPLGPFSESP